MVQYRRIHKFRNTRRKFCAVVGTVYTVEILTYMILLLGSVESGRMLELHEG